MERLGSDTFSSVMRYVDPREIVHMRELNKGYRAWIDSSALTSKLLHFFPRIRAAHVAGETFATAVRRWTAVRVFPKSQSAFFPLNEGIKLTAMTWAGGDRVAIAYRDGEEAGLQEWDLTAGKCLGTVQLGAFHPTELEQFGQSIVVWDCDMAKVVDRRSGEVHNMVGPTSTVVADHIATVDTHRRSIYIYNARNMKEPVEVIGTRLPPGILAGSRVFLTRDSVLLTTHDYMMTYSRSTGDVNDGPEIPGLYVQATPMGVMISEGKESRVTRIFPSSKPIDLENPWVVGGAGEYSVVEHVVQGVARYSLVDQEGRFLGDLGKRHYVYASDGVRLAAAVGSQKLIDIYRITRSGVVKEQEVRLEWKPRALAFTANYLVVALATGTLIRFPLGEPEPPKPKKGIRKLISHIKGK